MTHRIPLEQRRFEAREPTLSVRVLWPFVDATAADPRFMAVLRGLGIDAEHLSDRGRRIPCATAMTALARVIADLRDPTLGLRAADYHEGTFDAIERAWRHQIDLRAAMDVTQRYGQLLNEGMNIWLEVSELEARWCCDLRVPHPPAANDFLMASMLTFARRHCTSYAPPDEIHLMHDEPEYAAEYARYLEAPVRFGMPHNAIVFCAAALSVPLRSHNRALADAFCQHTQKLAQDLASSTLRR